MGCRELAFQKTNKFLKFTMGSSAAICFHRSLSMCFWSQTDFRTQLPVSLSRDIIPLGGMCEAFPLGVHLILFIFIPRREMRSISTRGPIVFTYVLFLVSKRTLEKKNGHPSSVILSEFFPRNVLFDGTGWGGV